MSSPGSRVLRALDSEQVHSSCSISIACACASQGFETPIHSCAYLRRGLRHFHSDSCRGLPFGLACACASQGFETPIHSRNTCATGGLPTRRGLGARATSTGERSKHQNAASAGKHSKHRSAERSLCRTIFSAFPLAQARLPVPHRSQSSPSKPADTSRMVCNFGFWTLRTEPKACADYVHDLGFRFPPTSASRAWLLVIAITCFWGAA